MIDLWSEEYWLWRKDRIDTEIWNLWQGGIAQAMRDSDIRQEWKALRERYAGQADFVALVDAFAEAKSNAKKGPG